MINNNNNKRKKCVLIILLPQTVRQLRRTRPTKHVTSYALASGAALDPLTLVQCERFNEARTEQPFRVTITSSALFVMDLHSHLSTTEVIGYLAGRWDAPQRLLHIDQAVPCSAIETESEDSNRAQTVEMDPASEMKARDRISSKEQQIVGWYHSHPAFKAEPSLRDIENQTSFQTLFQTKDESGVHEPFVGFIVGEWIYFVLLLIKTNNTDENNKTKTYVFRFHSLFIAPYDRECPGAESTFKCFWVAQHHNRGGFGTPMAAVFDAVRDPSLTAECISDVVGLLQYYERFPDRVNMGALWRTVANKQTSNLAKLR